MSVTKFPAGAQIIFSQIDGSSRSIPTGDLLPALTTAQEGEVGYSWPVITPDREIDPDNPAFTVTCYANQNADIPRRNTVYRIGPGAALLAADCSPGQVALVFETHYESAAAPDLILGETHIEGKRKAGSTRGAVAPGWMRPVSLLYDNTNDTTALAFQVDTLLFTSEDGQRIVENRLETGFVYYQGMTLLMANSRWNPDGSFTLAQISDDALDGIPVGGIYRGEDGLPRYRAAFGPDGIRLLDQSAEIAALTARVAALENE